ncbi:hypothetical protein ACE6ED_24680, partial [Paenibacillus sp. CN-4]|uniref:hypothetical protein n=1 Tax=Paenibacillus nanchangensis TaxID=3348343 RepID=UPI00397908A3
PLTRCSVFKDQASRSLPVNVSSATLILYHVLSKKASSFFDLVFRASQCFSAGIRIYHAYE